MDHPSWFPYRYAFLFPFWAISCACRGFSETDRNRGFIWTGLIWLIPLAASYLSGKGMTLSLLLINTGFLAAYTAFTAFFTEKSLTILFSVLCSAELFLNGGMIIDTFADRYTKLADYKNFHEHYRSLAASLLPEADNFYRMEKTAFRNYNDPLGIGFPGVSHFSSTASTRQAEFLKRIGFNCYATWCTYQGSTAATDALLRIRYEFAENGKSGNIETGSETWEHPAQFPLFFFAEDSFLRYDFFSDNITAIPRQNDILRLLEGSGAEDYFEPLPVRILQTVNLSEDDGIFRRLDPENPAYIVLEVRTEPGRSSYLFISKASLNYNVFIGDSRIISANRDYAPFPICLDPYSPDNGTVQVRVETVTGSVEGDFLAWSLDPEKLLRLSEQISGTAPVTERTGRTAFRLQTDAADADRTIASSIPFDAGWRVKADGKPLDLKMIHGSMLGFTLPEGCTEVMITYRPYGWEAGLAITIMALIMSVIVTAAEIRKKKSVS